jgi:sulfide:quinone oxidoreductase
MPCPALWLPARVKQHVLILGAGFAGLELATRLSESVADEVLVTLIDESDSFHFGFSKLDVMMGVRSAAEVRLPYEAFSKPSVEFRRERITAIDPEARRVATDRDDYEADVLVVALGAAYDLAGTPGFAEGGVEYYSVEGAERMREAVSGFDSGTVVLAVLGQPFKCPPAPFEGALLLHEHFTRRGVRDDVEIRVLAPMSAPVPITKEVSAAFLEALGRRGIEYGAKQLVVAIDPEERRAQLESGGSVPYDLFVGVPIHRVPAVVADSGLTENGWVPVDRGTLRTRFENVYAVGDVAGTPNAKAGVFAEVAAGVVAEEIIATIRGGEPPDPFEGAGTCFIEFGDGRVGKVEANFFGGPDPTARLVGPSEELAAEKREFAATRRERWFGA